MNFKNEIKKLLDSGFGDNDLPQAYDEKCLNDINASIIKLNKIQKEVAINIEDIQSQLQESQNDETEIINVLISVIDYFDDFYNFASHDVSSPLFKQAEMMQNGILKKVSSLGLTRIHDEKTLFDSDINTIEATESNPNFSDGHIIKTLTNGYIYNGNVVRKSKVVIIKN